MSIESDIIEQFATADFVDYEWHRAVVSVAGDTLTYLLEDDYEGTLDIVRLAVEDDTFATYCYAARRSVFVQANREVIVQRFLDCLFSAFLRAELVAAVAAFNNPTIDFAALDTALAAYAKSCLPEIFDAA